MDRRELAIKYFFGLLAPPPLEVGPSRRASAAVQEAMIQVFRNQDFRNPVAFRMGSGIVLGQSTWMMRDLRPETTPDPR
jgi:hypothetical protein